jgi:hypothetical protein
VWWALSGPKAYGETAGRRVEREEIVTEHLAQLIFSGQPHHLIGFHRVERPLDSPVEMEARFPAGYNQFDDHVTDSEYRLGDLWPRDEEHVAVGRRPRDMRGKPQGEVAGDHGCSMARRAKAMPMHHDQFRLA